MNDGRYSHTASLLLDGTVLITGGQSNNTQYLNSTELYDPSTEAWTIVGSMHHARSRHTATVLTNGQVLVTGGYNGITLNNVEIYNLQTGIWTLMNSMKDTRNRHTATLLTNGNVLLIGGLSNDSVALNTCELFRNT